jgi:hypothetical protein
MLEENAVFCRPNPLTSLSPSLVLQAVKRSTKKNFFAIPVNMQPPQVPLRIGVFTQKSEGAAHLWTTKKQKIPDNDRLQK